MEIENRNYVVLIGDISGSKQLTGASRYQTQLFMKSAIVQINEQFQSLIEAPLTITKGDEFQALLPDISCAFSIILALEKITHPVQFRFGIGVGNVYKMGGYLPIEMDGPAFHFANAALQMAKKKKVFWWIHCGDELFDTLINTSFILMAGIKSKWNERHYRLYWSYKELGTYREVAAQEGVTPQAICDTLKNIRATEIITAENNLMKALKELDKKLIYAPESVGLSKSSTGR